MLRWTIIGAIFLLQACAGSLPPITSSDSHPSTAWQPSGEPRAVVLAVHGFNDHRTAFREFASWAAEQGILVEAYDQRGFGESPDRGLWAGAEQLASDLTRHVRDLRVRHPDRPLFVLGESMGAAVTILAFSAREAPAIDGLILSAPAVWGGEAMSPFYRGALWVMRRLAPGMTFTGRGLGRMASDNLPMLRGLAADPLFIKETRVDAIAGLVDLMGDARDRGPSLALPLLILQGQRDEIVPPQAQLDFVASLREPACTLISYPEGWHMLLRDLQRERVWRDVLAWMAGATPPSGLQRPCASAAVASTGASPTG